MLLAPLPRGGALSTGRAKKKADALIGHTLPLVASQNTGLKLLFLAEVRVDTRFKLFDGKSELAVPKAPTRHFFLRHSLKFNLNPQPSVRQLCRNDCDNFVEP
jgi:hypothetical protein